MSLWNPLPELHRRDVRSSAAGGPPGEAPAPMPRRPAHVVVAVDHPVRRSSGRRTGGVLVAPLPRRRLVVVPHLENSFWSTTATSWPTSTARCAGSPPRRIRVDEAAWPALVAAARFESMKGRRRPAPRPDGPLRGGTGSFLYQGSNGRWRDALTDDDLVLYDRAAASLDPALRCGSKPAAWEVAVEGHGGERAGGGPLPSAGAAGPGPGRGRRRGTGGGGAVAGGPGRGARFATAPVGSEVDDWFALLRTRFRGVPGEGLAPDRILPFFHPRLSASAALR